MLNGRGINMNIFFHGRWEIKAHWEIVSKYTVPTTVLMNVRLDSMTNGNISHTRDSPKTFLAAMPLCHEIRHEKSPIFWSHILDLPANLLPDIILSARFLTPDLEWVALNRSGLKDAPCAYQSQIWSAKYRLDKILCRSIHNVYRHNLSKKAVLL